MDEVNTNRLPFQKTFRARQHMIFAVLEDDYRVFENDEINVQKIISSLQRTEKFLNQRMINGG